MQKLVAFTTFMLIALGIGVGAICPAAYIDLGTGCYHFSVQGGLTWEQAYFTCQLEVNGYLVEVGSQQEQDNLRAYIHGVLDPNNQICWWFGGTDILQEGTFRWMTSGSELTYSAWYSHDVPGSTPNPENCISIFDNRDLLWRDYTCSMTTYQNRPMKAICETDPIE